jgi:hypothetical protein
MYYLSDDAQTKFPDFILTILHGLENPTCRKLNENGGISRFFPSIARLAGASVEEQKRMSLAYTKPQ